MFQSLEGIKEDRDRSPLALPPRTRFQSLEGIKEDRDLHPLMRSSMSTQKKQFQSLEGIKEDRDLCRQVLRLKSFCFSPWKGLRKIATALVRRPTSINRSRFSPWKGLRKIATLVNLFSSAHRIVGFSPWKGLRKIATCAHAIGIVLTSYLFQSLEGIKEDRDKRRAASFWTKSPCFSPWKGLRKIATVEITWFLIGDFVSVPGRD